MRTTAVIIGAGQAGLAMSRRLTERSIDHVVVERGEIANSWRTERWDSLRLLTPNWMTRLPGRAYNGPDPDGHASASEVAAFIDRYSTAISAPVQTGTTVTAVTATGDGYEVRTDRDHWRCRAVVVASGACNLAAVPPVADDVPPGIAVLTPLTYRNPADLEQGGVLVVGASATGAQLAEEIHRSGRPVTLSVGEHVRLPRTYRGRDIFWWTDRAGILDERHNEIDDIVRARNLPSPQLIGSRSGRSIDLDTLADHGVAVVGRLVGIVGDTAQFSGSLPNICALADLKANRLLSRLDEWAAGAGLEGDLGPPERLPPTAVATSKPVLERDLRQAGIRSIVFATGYRPDLSWLRLPVFDRRGRIRHDGGMVDDAPGIFVVGHPVLRRRRSSYIDGTVRDSAELSRLLHSHLDRRVQVGVR
ncbi:MAG: NAD(P)-binding domain-containing protein [Acidimicrobiia bacterium]|nr:NAD(P)-binding domain-containing protein [Acidimicrobiia bacterium]